MKQDVTVGMARRHRGRVSPDARRELNLALVLGLLARAGQPTSQDRATLRHDPLGRPLLTVNHAPGPRVSFSHCGGFTWAALALGRESVGVDATSPAEFQGPYPFQRAFHSEEWSIAEKMLPRPEAAALLWSAKEAAVKAWGCGFTLFDPLDVRVKPYSQVNSSLKLWRGRGPFDLHVFACNDGKRRLLGHGEQAEARVWSFPINPEGWVAVALASHNPPAPQPLP